MRRRKPRKRPFRIEDHIEQEPKPRKRITPELEAKIVRRTEEGPFKEGQSYWTTRGLAEVYGVSDETIRRIWKRNGVAPHPKALLQLRGRRRASGWLSVGSIDLGIKVPSWLKAHWQQVAASHDVSLEEYVISRVVGGVCTYKDLEPRDEVEKQVASYLSNPPGRYKEEKKRINPRGSVHEQEVKREAKRDITQDEREREELKELEEWAATLTKESRTKANPVRD